LHIAEVADVGRENDGGELGSWTSLANIDEGDGWPGR